MKFSDNITAAFAEMEKLYANHKILIIYDNELYTEDF